MSAQRFSDRHQDQLAALVGEFSYDDIPVPEPAPL